MSTGEYDEALARLHAYGPEFDGYLSNHGPMVVEAMWHQGMPTHTHRWVDDYVVRLDPAPLPGRPIDDWREALGDPGRAGDWIEHFRVACAERPWSEVVAQWWPRLLPGIAAGATHGVIRLGHVLRALRAAETEPRVSELGHALAYWATRWQRVPLIAPTGEHPAALQLSAIPRVADQSAGIRHRLAQLADTPTYADAVADGHPADDVDTALARLVDAAVTAYGRFAPGNPTMLVHAATAPNAVAMALPSLPAALARESYTAAWSASCAVVAAYRPETPQPPDAGPSVGSAFEAALAHGSEHVLKFTDTALDSYHRTGDYAALNAVGTAIRLDA